MNDDIITQLVAIRYRRGLTSADVAQRMNTGRPNVAHFEGHRRSPTLATILRYAKAVGAHLTVEEEDQ